MRVSAVILVLLAAAGHCTAASTCDTAHALLQQCGGALDLELGAGCCPLLAAFHLRGCLEAGGGPRTAREARDLRALSTACAHPFPQLDALPKELATQAAPWMDQDEAADAARPAVDLAADVAGGVAGGEPAPAEEALRGDVLAWVEAVLAREDGAVGGGFSSPSDREAAAALRAMLLPSGEDTPDIFELAEAYAQARGEPGPLDPAAALLRRKVSLGVTVDGSAAEVASAAASLPAWLARAIAALPATAAAATDQPATRRASLRVQFMREGPPRAASRCGAPLPPLQAGAPFGAALAHRFAGARGMLCRFSSAHPLLLAGIVLAQVGAAAGAAAALLARGHGDWEEREAAQFLVGGGGYEALVVDASDPEWAQPLLSEDERAALAGEQRL
jgi:hypothetical protein